MESKNTIQTIEQNGDEYCSAATREDFEQLVREMGWADIAEFEADTRVKADWLIGKFFTVVRNTIHLLS